MAKNAIVTVPSGGWVELTDSNVTRITIVHRGGGEVTIQGSTSSTAPTTDPAFGLPLWAKDPASYGMINELLSDLFPHISAVRVFAYANGAPAQILVMHA